MSLQAPTGIKHDSLSETLVNQIVAGVNQVDEANEVLLAADEQGAKVREIDKAIKETEHGNKKVSAAWAEAEKLAAAAKEAKEKARNLYRVEVLKEEEVKTPTHDVDEEAVKGTRNLVMQAVKLLTEYAEQNKMKDVTAWLQTVSIPQVGRKGTTSAAGGSKKPRAYVSVNDSTFDSFGEAAKALSAVLSTDDNKVSVTSPDLVQAWENAGSKEVFEYSGQKIKVVEKKKAEAAK